MTPPYAPSDYAQDRVISAHPGDIVLGRYALVEGIGFARGTSLWQAWDQVEDVAVRVRITPMDSPIISTLRGAAERARVVRDEHAVRVIEIATDRSLDSLIIVSEFSKGLTLADILVIEGGRPLLTTDAVTIAHEVSLLLRRTHAEGVYHGSITPDSVVVTLDGDVRLAGLEVDEILLNQADSHDRRHADIHAVGAILYAGLTGVWPDPLDELETTGSQSARSGIASRPSQVATGVPPGLDEITVRALAPTTGSGAFPSMAELEAALAAWGTIPLSRSLPTPVPRRRRRRLRSTAIALGILTAISLVGLALALGVGSEPLVKPTPHATSSAASASAAKQ